MNPRHKYVFITMFGLISVLRGGQPSWMPQTQHYQAAIQARNCEAHRSFNERMKRQLADEERVATSTESRVKSAKEALDHCGGDGLPSEQLAERCPDLYETWLNEGSRLRLIQRDVQSARDQLHQTSQQMHLLCR